MKFLAKSFVFAALWAAIGAAPAAAQTPEERINVTFTPAFATVGGDTETALAGSVGYRFTEHLSFEGDFTWIDAAAGGIRDRQFALEGREITTGIVNDVLRRNSGMFGGNNRLPSFNLGNISNIAAIPIGAGNFSATADGQTMIGTLGVRYEPSVQTARFRPYVSGGLGLNHTEQELTVAITTATQAFDESVSHSGFAFSAGGGANIRLFSSVWASADAKYFRLSRDRNVMRLGGGIGLRF
jgi:opacity protein-like surface antigen